MKISTLKYLEMRLLSSDARISIGDWGEQNCCVLMDGESGGEIMQPPHPSSLKQKYS